MLFDITVLERRPIVFDEIFPPGIIDFSGSDWKQMRGIHATGKAEMLDPAGAQTIRVRGRIEGSVESVCARCLEPFTTQLDGLLDLFYYPMRVIAKKEDVPIDKKDTDIGFYEDPGVELADVLREQILLWLPMRGLCRENCKGICPHCGTNLNTETCSCAESFTDPRWDALRNLHYRN